ncbi:MAG: V-type ATP synthase subunit D [Spirochaetales bacterium]|nr:V-type ATP synthase subunit D [Spirochaetales bacterium]
MARIKLTKNELKKQKDSLKRFQRYLPTLQLKKQQLQLVIRQIEAKERDVRAQQEKFKTQIDAWIEVFGDEFDITPYTVIEKVERDRGNIAGVDIPVFKGLSFKNRPWDVLATPVWIDPAIENMKKLVAYSAELKVLEIQRELLGKELRITTQRVNLFEKVKIPETKEHIRRIRIYLGDEQTASVVRGKIAKGKTVKVS